MARQYASIRDQINLASYLCYLPETYAPPSEYSVTFNIPSLYEHDRNTQQDLSKGMATIAHMVDMYHNRHNFIIINLNDVLEICYMLEEYFKQCELIHITAKEHRYFIDKARNFYKALQIERKKIFIQRGLPNPDDSTLRNLLSLLA